MNSQIKDVQAQLSVSEFKKMLYTAYGRSDKDAIDIIYNKILKVVSTNGQTVSIPKLSSLIDYFNFCPYK